MKFFPQNKSKRTIFITSTILFLFLTPLVYAATSADFQTKAQKYITNNCSKKSPSNEESLLCFLYYKISEHQIILSSQNAKISSLETKISSLESKIVNLGENKIKTVVFANNRPQPFNSEWVDVTGGYTNLTITLTISGGIANYGIHFTNDPVNATDQTGYTIQQFVQCDGNSSCPITTLPILGNYYRISTGTANGNITSNGILKNY